jgi:hypothetical protein
MEIEFIKISIFNINYLNYNLFKNMSYKILF